MVKPRKKSRGKSTNNESKYKCELCDDRDKSKPIVACDVCDKWHHFSCVNLVSISKKDPWLCDKCTEKMAKKSKASKASDTLPTYSCDLCLHIDNDEMILCDTCQRRYHYVCVQLDLSKLPDSYMCDQCHQRRSVQGNVISTPMGTGTFNRSQSMNRLEDFSPLASHQATVPQSHYRQIYDAKDQLMLEYLEEHRMLQQKWDRKQELREQEHLLQKYNALRERIDLVEPENQFRQNEKEFVNTSQYDLNRELTRVNGPRDSFDQADFTERLKNLAFANTSPLKGRASVKDNNFTTSESINHHVYANQQSRMSSHNKFESPIHQNSNELNEQARSFELPRDSINDQRLQKDPSSHPNFRNAVNTKTPLANDDLQLPSNGQPIRTLTKAQIASRQVVKYSLHNFYGDPLEWISWYSSYESTTEMCGYTDAENLHRLKECLKGSAETAVKHRFLSPTEVPNIIKTLKMLFGRPDLIVNALLRKVKDIPAPRADKLETLVDYAMEVNSISVTIESAKINYHLSNPNLIHELVEKLPVHTKIDWAKFTATQTNITLKVLADWLYSLAEVVCTVTVPNSSKPSNKFDKKAKTSERLNVHQLGNEHSKVSIDQHNQQMNVRQCKVCKGQCTDASKCSTFKSYDIKQKWDLVNKSKICRRCLKTHNGFCRQNKDCGVNGCVYKHHPLLHSDKRTTTTEDKPQERQNANVVSAVVTNNFHDLSIPNILFRIVPVTLHNEGVVINTYAYLDEGSSGTLMEENLAKELQLVGSPERLCLLWTNNVHRIEDKSQRMDVVISGQLEFNARYLMRGVRTVKDLGLPSQTINLQQLAKKFPYLAEVPLISYYNEAPRLLIGLPHARLCTQLKTIEGGECQPIASKSRIGWSLHGPTRESQESYVQQINEHRVNVCQKRSSESDDELHRLVKDHFTLENFGVNLSTEFNMNSRENQRCLDILNSSTEYINGRYRTALLWRYDECELEDSYEMAKRRLICLERSKKEHIPTIEAVINDYIRKGYVTKLKSEDLSVNRSKVGYLPIFIVTHPKKPEKIRMVFDAAAKTNGQSLNDMLLKGPDQLNSLVDILRRFREHVIVICGDIEEMYHRIEVREQDRHVQRFLWRSGKTDEEPSTYVLNVMTFGAKCSPSVAQYIKNKNAEQFRQQHPRAVNAIVSNTYVDDMMDGDETEEKVIQLINEVKKIHDHGGFKIGKFLSNSTNVLKALGEPKHTADKQLNLDPTQQLERVLGMFWNTNKDCFKFSLKYTKINEEVINGLRYPTKREVLQTLMSIFDPLGLVQHFLIQLKVLLQNVWRSNLKWDDQLTADEHKNTWDSWFKLLPKIETLEIPRLYSSNLTTSTVDLHIFVDASENAFATVAFLRIESQHQTKCVLIGSKARVAPIKYVSIPRLELQAGVLGTRFMNSIEKSQNINFKRRIIWTDSSTVISWLRSDHKKYQQFVAHRIGEIQENSDLEMWRWLPGKDNVADDATKWERIPTFDQNSRWFNGPEFLYQSEEHWPREETRIASDTVEEMKIHCLYTRLIPPPIIDPSRFSNWNRMVRALAYVVHYTRILRAKIYKEVLPRRTLSQDELLRSKNLILRQAQYEGFPDEMAILKRNQNLSQNSQRDIPKSSSIISCSPYLDQDGILRVRGRIDAAINIPIDQKRPIILPKKNYITNLLIGCFHGIYLHRNHETVINEIRQKFYVPQLRAILKKVRKNCQRCKILCARPQPPEMGNLPFARLAIGFKVFTYTGIDYFGPIKIVDGRVPKKRWGVIFTCLTVRAIHIEIAHSLDTQSCIFAIRNFIVRHGTPKEIYSDNGTNLVGANNELLDAIEDLDLENMASTFTTCYTEWKFNPPSAPHQGGVWERLIRSIKTGLYAIMPSDHFPTDEQLKNLLAEVQFVVNSRPLTFIPLEDEADEALTPNHFLFGTSDGSKPIIPPTDRRDLRSKWRENQRLADLFWIRSVKEYLPTLTRRTKWFTPVLPMEVGDLVLMMDEEGPRNSYPRAKIIEVMPDINGQVRRVRIQRHDKKILIRSTHKLAKLDVAPYQERFDVQPRNTKTGWSVTNGGSPNLN